jgi:hypothetical protein
MAIVVALLSSALCGLVSVRSAEVQPAVIVIGVTCFILGFALPNLAWLWALIVGLGVFLGYLVAGLVHYAVKAPPDPNIYGSLIAFVPAFIAAYLGAAARWIAAPSMPAGNADGKV